MAMAQSLIVLLIDDNPNDRLLAMRVLQHEFPDIVVIEVADAAALESAITTVPFDAVITDYQLRWSDGLAVLKTVKGRYPERPVVMFTSSGTAEVAVEAMKQGLDDYLVKSPGQYARLATTVQAVLQRRRDLRLSDARYRAVLETIPQLLWTLAPDGAADSFNSQWRAYTGCSDTQSLGAGWWDVIHPDDREQLLVRRTAALTCGEPYEIEARIRRHDGAYRWHMVRVVPLRGAAEVLAWYGSATDIHTLKQNAERIERLQELTEALAEAERASRAATEQSQRQATEALSLLDTLVNRSPVGMAFVDREFRFVRINDALAAINGLPAAAHLGRTGRELFGAAAGIWEGYWQQIIATGTPMLDLELRSDYYGAARYYLVSYYPVSDPDGAVLGIGMVVLDISERRRTEGSRALLADASKVLAASLNVSSRMEQLGALLVPTFADWYILDMPGNEARPPLLVVQHQHEARAATAGDVRARLASDSGTPIGLSAVVPAGQPALFGDLTNPALFASEHRDYAQQLRDLGMVSAVCVPLLIEGRVRGSLTFGQAESRRRFDEHDLELAEDLGRRCALAIENATLYQAERQARASAEAAVLLRDQFLSVAAHELKTPLTSLLGYVEMLNRRLTRTGEVTERDQRQLAVVVSQALRLNAMISGLLDISRIEAGQLAIERAPTDLAALVQRVVDEVALITSRHEIVYSAPSDALIIDGDALRLEQVLQNLLQNAIKYSPHGGQVQVQISQGEHWLRIAVSDEGIGIPPQALSRLFTRFYRADNAATQQISGMGVGLYVVREIVAQHGGEVRVESTEGHGSTFTVLLPLADGLARQA